ncbi:MAG: alpha/beta family hydrolase [Actinomycetes bacterium]
MTERVRLRTPEGDARVHIDPALGRRRALLVLGHGAGGGVEAADLVALARHLPNRGVTVVRVEQPWRVAGRRLAPRPAALDAAWGPAVAAAVRTAPDLPLLVGGRSAGARVACRCASKVGALAVLALAFPLHPPGRPDRSRAAELAVGMPLLVVQGERDPFGRPEEFAGVQVVPIPAADHGFQVPRRGPITGHEALTMLTEAVGPWVEEVADPSSGRESSPRVAVLPPA